MRRCMRGAALRQVADRACAAAVSRCCLDRVCNLAPCDLWPDTSTAVPQPFECFSSSANSVLANTGTCWHGHSQAQPLRTPSTEAASRRAGAPAATGRSVSSHNRQEQSRAGQPWNSHAPISGHPLGRRFATESKNQTQAEKFDLIRQEAGTVRVEGYVPETRCQTDAPPSEKIPPRTTILRCRIESYAS